MIKSRRHLYHKVVCKSNNKEDDENGYDEVEVSAEATVSPP